MAVHIPLRVVLLPVAWRKPRFQHLFNRQPGCVVGLRYRSHSAGRRSIVPSDKERVCTLEAGRIYPAHCDRGKLSAVDARARAARSSIISLPRSRLSCLPPFCFCSTWKRAGKCPEGSSGSGSASPLRILSSCIRRPRGSRCRGSTRSSLNMYSRVGSSSSAQFDRLKDAMRQRSRWDRCRHFHMH